MRRRKTKVRIDWKRRYAELSTLIVVVRERARLKLENRPTLPTPDHLKRIVRLSAERDHAFAELDRQRDAACNELHHRVDTKTLKCLHCGACFREERQ